MGAIGSNARQDGRCGPIATAKLPRDSWHRPACYREARPPRRRAVRFRRMSEPPRLKAGQVWRKSRTARVAVTAVDVDHVETVLHDDTAGSSSVWIATRNDFDSFELIEDPA